MTSNTKLTAVEKDVLKDMKADANFDGIKLVSNVETTIAYLVLGNSVEFATASASPDELKFRRKVGEFHALQRFYYNHTGKVGRETFQNILDTGFVTKDGVCPDIL